MPVLGVSSIYMYSKSILDAIEHAAMMGFRHINIFAYPPHFKEDSEDFVRKIKEALFRYGLDCSLKVQGYTINLAATNPNLRRRSFEEMEIWIDVASKLGCSSIVIRAGMFFYSERVFREKTYRRLISDLRKIVDRANSQGMDVLIENYPYPFDVVVMPSDFIRLQKTLRQRVYLALNIPHLYDVYKTHTRVDMEAEIQHVLPWVKMLYIGEHVNPWDYPHRPSGEDMKKYMEFVGRMLRILRRGEIGTIILIGYSEEDLKKLKKLASMYFLV